MLPTVPPQKLFQANNDNKASIRLLFSPDRESIIIFALMKKDNKIEPFTTASRIYSI